MIFGQFYMPSTKKDCVQWLVKYFKGRYSCFELSKKPKRNLQGWIAGIRKDR